MKNEWFYKRMYGNLKALLVFSKNFPLSKISRVFLENPFEVVCPSQDFIVDPCNSDLIFGKYKDSVTCSSPHDVPNFSLLQTKSFIWIIFTQSRVLALIFKHLCFNKNKQKTRFSWLNCALRDDEAVYWVSIGHYEAVAVGNWWYWASRGHLCLYILHKVEISSCVTDALRTDWQTLKD